MLVKKNVFGLSPLGSCTIEDVKDNCVLDFLQNLCKINKENSTYDVDDDVRLNKFSQEISFDTNLLKFEMSINADSILEENLEHIKQENSFRLNNSSRKDEVQAVDGQIESEIEPLMLDQQVLDVLNINGSINIKIINLGNTDYYFYTI